MRHANPQEQKTQRSRHWSFRMTETERRRRFDELYASYDRRVLAYCIHVTGNRDTANDVFQEVFVKAYKSLHTLREEDRAANWLFRIARNECLNSLKSVQRSERRTVRIETSLVEPSSPTFDPAERRDETEHLRRGLAQLSEEQREALLLAEFEGFSLKEIAEITGASLSNVKVRIHRAKQKLHSLLEPILNDHE
jgi:RNA polymerase sigma-70 factor (ECF subfamily)